MARESFWGFCIANFINGLFSSTLTVSLAYVSDVHPSRAEKDREIGQLVGLNMLGITGGGIIAILMQETGLFRVTWPWIAGLRRVHAIDEA